MTVLSTSAAHPSIRIAALLTCHNRRETTLRSLRHLVAQDIPQHTRLSVLLVDDGSSDGTAAAVAGEFPQVRLLKGDGSLYWGGGMRRAFAEALAEDYDYYLWLNDDTSLDRGAIAGLMAAHWALAAHGEDRTIVVGSTRAPGQGAVTYGGFVRAHRLHPLKFRLLEPSAHAQFCITMNGNVVLIPRAVAERAGNISEHFTQGMGDFDYALRARKLGCAVCIAPGYAGECRRNRAEGTWLDASLPLREQIRKTLSVKGLPPREYMHFARAHGGPLWPVFWTMPYVRVALSRLLKRSER